MRGRASESGIPVPVFVPLVNDEQVREFMGRVPPPWILKPRLMAGTIGIRKLHKADDLWNTAAGLGDQRSFYLLEQFVQGDIFHVDSAVWNGAVVRAVVSRYGTPPFTVSHGGGVFTTRLVERGSTDDRALQSLNAAVLSAALRSSSRSLSSCFRNCGSSGFAAAAFANSSSASLLGLFRG